MRDLIIVVVSLAGIAVCAAGSPRNILLKPMRLLLTVLGSMLAVLGSMLAPSSRFPDELVTLSVRYERRRTDFCGDTILLYTDTAPPGRPAYQAAGKKRIRPNETTTTRGDNGMLVTGTYTSVFTKNPKIPPGHGNLLFVLERTGDVWKIRAMAHSPVLR